MEKSVRFNDAIQLRYMWSWMFAYRQARKGWYWEQCARDRARFQRRIENFASIIEPVLLSKIQMYNFNKNV
jgi:Phosphatase-1 catalytic subunit binding region